ncbi:M28 family peptidase [Streptomyces sp. NBC_01304]|uniref:M28 family peptidase n=1 Tax=Streptomyces sp. NBC_01304 TaxID=2903818 RepID=UPI002E125596|nr:M28 family peptidase [Streptomyces sp. NBC_01304]
MLPSSDEMLRWIAAITEQGVRRPGYPADDWTCDWAARRLRDLGLGVRLEPLDTPRWRPHSASLRVALDADPGRAVELAGFPLPYTAATAGVTAPVRRLGESGGPGCLVVDELAFSELRQSEVRDLATAVHDPEGAFDELTQLLPFGPGLTDVLGPARAAGATGFVGALTGVPWDTREYYVPYDAEPRPLPAVWISGSDGRHLLELLDAGPCTGTLTVDASTDTVTTHNVVATLPGASGHWAVVASHHDGPWASAVEDGTGIAMVLAAATYWAEIPAPDRPHNLLFLLASGHMAGGAGTRAFIDAHRGLLDDVVVQLHLEHAARRCETVDGKLVPTDDPEVRWWFTSRSPRLESLVARTLRAEDLRRSLVLPPDVFSPMPPTDGAFFHPEGVPLVHFLSAPPYLFDPADTLDKVDAAGLESLVRASVRIVEGTKGWTPDSARV